MMISKRMIWKVVCYTLVLLLLNIKGQSQTCIPHVNSSQKFTASEDLNNGVVVGTVAAKSCGTDRPIGGWTIVLGNELGVFDINGATGELFINDRDALDAETNTVFNLKITVSDGLVTSAEQEVIIEILDVNDNPPIITADQQFEVSESALEHTSIGMVEVTDADLSTNEKNWTIVSGNSINAFEIRLLSGELLLSDDNVIDAEKTTFHQLEIMVSDGIHTTTETVSIQVINENDTPPQIDEEQQFIIDEIASLNFEIGSLTAFDEDGEGILENWKIVDGNADLDGDGIGAFAIVEKTGLLKVSDPDDLDFGLHPLHILTVSVSDGINQSIPVAIKVQLIDFDREDCDQDGVPNYQDPFSCTGFTVPVVFTPNGDGQNDQLIIEGLEEYPQNFVRIINRWGAVVWENNGYDNDLILFEGFANRSVVVRGAKGNKLPDGTYFYFLNPNDGRGVQKGFFTIKR